MNQTRSKGCWRADSPSTSSGRNSETTINHERGKLVQETREDSMMTLMKLRKLSMKLMSKNERLRYSERKLCQSNVFKFLDSHLTHSSEKVRYLTLEVLCYTIPRLGEKTSKLLSPIMPKVIQRLRGNEEKDIKLKALHFLRGYFRHTRNLSGFIEDYIHLGLENADSEARISCLYGISIIFDQDIGDNHFSPLVGSVANQLSKNNRPEIIRAGYRALKFIHSTIGEDRFFELMRTVNPDILNIYGDFFTFEASDPFLSIRVNDCSTLASAYQVKRRNLNLNKDFGILDCNLLDKVEKTRSCERAKAVANFAISLKSTLWTDADLDTHILDLLKLIISFIGDSNRLTQMSGFSILKVVINRMGFILSPHIRLIVQILLETLTSANSKIISKTKKVLHKLMLNIHPMTVMWELLDSSTPSQKEVVLILVEEKIKYFPYHELDMNALCSYLGQTLEDENLNVAKYSRQCISLLLDVMRDCPSYGDRSEAVRVLLRNYKLSRDTLKDIGILGHGDEDYLESFESYSGDETLELVLENAFLEHSESSSGTEDGTVSETASDRTRCYNDDFKNNVAPASSRKQSTGFTTSEVLETPNRLKLTGKAKKDFLPNLKIRRLSSAGNSASKDTILNQNKESFSPGVSTDAKNSANHLQNMNTGAEQKRFTSLWADYQNHESEDDFQDSRSTGDAEIYLKKGSLNPQKEALYKNLGDFVIESYEKDGIQVDVMNKNLFNFNIMKIENPPAADGIEEIDDSDFEECEAPVTSSPIYRKILKSVQMDSPGIGEDIPDFEETGTISSIFPLTPISNITPLNTGKSTYMAFSPKEIPSEIYANVTHIESSDYVRIKMKNKEQKEAEYCENETAKSKESSELSSNIREELLKDENESCGQEETIRILDDMKRKHKAVDLKIAQDNNISDDNNKQEETKTVVENLNLCPPLDETETPFLPRSRQLPRTPVEKKRDNSSEIVPKSVKNKKRHSVTNKKKKAEVKARENSVGGTVGSEKRSDKPAMKSRASSLPQSGREATVRLSCSLSKHNSPSNWGGCQWRRDLDFAAKGATCSWADNFEQLVDSMQAFPSSDVAESEMKKAVEDLFGKSWKAKEDAMLKMIRLAKHHPELVHDNASKIVVALSNEIKNFRQSVAGKAILTTGHLYEIMGRHFENKLRLVVAALLAKSGNRTLAAYYRIVIKCLAKITNSTAPQKAAMAFIQEGSRHANKAARETAAQFLSVLTESMGPENSLANFLCSQIMKCAAMFVSDGSALTRYCGKCMFKIFMRHPEFEKLKDHHLDINTVQNLNKILEQIRTKGISQEILPINIIE